MSILCIFIWISLHPLLSVAGLELASTTSNDTTLSALLAFKASISHDPTSSLASWNVSSAPDYCTWHGIGCANGTHHVSHLVLDSNELTGTLTPQLGALSHLSNLSIHNNSFDGPIPPELGILSGLLMLNLGANKLTGTIPPTLANCSLLQYMDLGSNTLSSQLPPFLTNLTNLQYLALGQNNFSGYIPREIGQLTQVQWLDFSENPELTGGIPDTIGGCRHLQRLYLQHTRLGGSLPAPLFNLTNLQYLVLSSSEFTGSLSEWVQNLTSLISLFLDGNALEGEIPAALGNLSHIQGLDLQGNKFQGSIPPQLSGCASLFEMDLSYNSLTGSIPAELGQLTFLSNLYLQNNRLSGGIPDMFKSLIRLQRLNLAHNILTGSIPDSLIELETLQVLLDLSFNNLSGPIPSGMQMLVTLRLSSNQFTGQIAEGSVFLGVEILDLSNNQLQGQIPSSLGQMKGLQYLNLSQNRFSGSLPSSLGDLQNLVSLNVSYNSLEGIIPSVGIYKKSPASSFVGNPGLCGYPLHTGCSSSANNSVHGAHHSNTPVIILSLCLGGGVLFVAILCACFCWCRSAANSNGQGSFNESEDGIDDTFDIENPQYKVWTAHELRALTNGFDAANVIRAGEVSVCFRGVLKRGKGKKRLVAVKRLRAGSTYGAEVRESFVKELRALCKVRHRNLVKLEGYCVDEGEVALVMEYMEGGNLGECLQTMSWEERVSVAADVAEGLTYLHHECVQPIIHCDLKPANILLTSDMTAKINDFGIARLLKGGHATLMGLSTSEFRGTFGYADPDYAGGSRFSPKIDVYSFGVILLELISGLEPSNRRLQEHGVSLHGWVRNLQESGNTKEAIDKVLHNAIQFDPTILEEVENLLNMGLKCSSELSKNRPTMRAICEYVVGMKKNTLHKMHSNLTTT